MTAFRANIAAFRAIGNALKRQQTMPGRPNWQQNAELLEHLSAACIGAAADLERQEQMQGAPFEFGMPRSPGTS